MANKSNIRSFRYSDEIACILNQQPGESLNAKFEYLVESCYCDIERRQEELARINQQIEQRRQVLHNLENATEELNRLEKDILAAKNSFCIVARRAAAIAEKADNL